MIFEIYLVDKLFSMVFNFLGRNLLEKEEEIKEIREQLQTLAKDFGIQGDSHVEIISQISRSYIK